MLRFVWILALSVPLTAQTVRPRRTTCRSEYLSVAFDQQPQDQIDGGAGHQAMTIALVNHSGTPCEIRGVPDVTLSDAEGEALSVRICPNCDDYLFRPQPALEVAVEPGQAAYLVVGYDTDEGAGPCRAASRMGILPAKDQRAISLPLNRGWRSCGRVDVTPFLVRPPVNGLLPDPGVANDQ